MFRIYDGRTDFYQWDIDRKLIIEDSSINQVHFCNRTDSCSLVCEVYEENGQRLVNVPNVLLQNDWRINVYGYDKNYTKHSAVFDVVKRSKPADYVYTETEIVTWERIEAKVDEINENIEAAVEKYINENGVDVDLSEYYTKTETDTAIEQAVAAIEIPEPDLSEYAKKTDIPSTTGLATEKYVDEKIEAIPEVDLTDYAKKADIPSTTGLATEQYVDDAIANIDIPDITGLATEKYVDDKLANIPQPDMSEYALKTDIPDTTGFITEEEATALINEAIGVIENGTY